MYEVIKKIDTKKTIRTSKYPVSDLGIGDGFDVPVDRDTKKSMRTSIIGCAEGLGIKVKTSTMIRPGFLRVWRVA